MTNKQPTGIEEIEKLAKLMHDTYEDKAREFGWSTQKKTRVAFRDLPESNKRTMLAVAEVVYATTRREAEEKIAEIYGDYVNPKLNKSEQRPLAFYLLNHIDYELWLQEREPQ